MHNSLSFLVFKFKYRKKYTVARLAKEKIEPKVKEMEEKGDILPEIRDLVFENGVCLILT